MITVANIGSGSKGNSTLVRDSNTTVLIDAGFSCRQLVLRLTSLGVEPEDLDAIVVTHEHSDHIDGLRVFTKRFGTPVYCTDKTADTHPIHNQQLSRLETFGNSEPFTIGSLDFSPFSIPHDAADPVAFVIETEGIRIGHCTDAGYPTELIRHSLKGCNLLVLESNHDYRMLIDGPYPWPLKQRIMGRTGHLNNESCAELLKDIYHHDLIAVRLAHLSQENNTGELASKESLLALKPLQNGRNVDVGVLIQDGPATPMTY